VASNAWITLDKGISRHHFMGPFLPKKEGMSKEGKNMFVGFARRTHQ